MNRDLERVLKAAIERIKHLEWLDSLRRDTLVRYAELLAERDMDRRSKEQTNILPSMPWGGSC